MTDQQINIAIARAIGMETQDKWGPLYKTNGGYVRTVPDFANDLNAMHEAEEVLTDAQYIQWASALTELWLHDNPPKIPNRLGIFRSASATARQRAEAFIKTFNIELK